MKKGHVALILAVSLLVTVWLVLKREFSLNKIGLRAVEELSEEGGKTVVSIEEVDAFFSEHSVVVFRGGEEVIGGQRTYRLDRCEFALGNPPQARPPVSQRPFTVPRPEVGKAPTRPAPDERSPGFGRLGLCLLSKQHGKTI